MRTFTIAAIVAALAMPAYAQTKTKEQKAADEKQEKLDEKAYKDTTSRTTPERRDQKTDPWGKMR